MSIFGKQKSAGARPSMTMRPTAPESRRPHHPPSTSPEQALQRIHVAADQARAEIASLVREEHEAMEETIAAACDDAEQRLRGATEQRIDNELKRVEEAEVEMRTKLQEIVRSEVAAELDKRGGARKPKSA